jgi:hypothetical protein
VLLSITLVHLAGVKWNQVVEELVEMQKFERSTREQDNDIVDEESWQEEGISQ